MVPKIPKYCLFLLKFWHPIRVITPPIRPETCSKRSNACFKYNSTSSIQWYAQISHSSNYDFWWNYSNRVLISLTSESISILCIFILNFYLYYKRLHLYYSYIYPRKLLLTINYILDENKKCTINFVHRSIQANGILVMDQMKNVFLLWIVSKNIIPNW
jgi:hypothetical protein